MTHNDIVRRAEKWLRGTNRCTVVLCETGVGEMPDAIGWTRGGMSILVECKVSRSDFLRDKHKPWRRNPDIGMGEQRYYMSPPGIISIDDLPEKWGLCEVFPKQVRVRRNALHFQVARGRWCERRLLIKSLARTRWNPIEKPPLSSSDEYLVYIVPTCGAAHIGIGFYDEGKWLVDIIIPESEYRITHWMIMPNKPPLLAIEEAQ